MPNPFDPKNLQSVAGLELLARTVLDGFFVGANRSQKSGVGQEFSQYRSYEPGDDIRLLDWKMYARSDRYYIKEAELESNITTRIIIDTSASMAHTEGNIHKLDYARGLTACLAYLAFQQGDAVGLYAINDTKIRQIAPRHDKLQLNRMLYELVKLQPEGKFPRETAEVPLQMGRGKELIVFISDLYEANDEIMRVLKSLSARRNEVILFHVLAENEVKYTYNGVITFEDLESGDTVKVNSGQHKDLYNEQIAKYLREIRQKLLEMNITYDQFMMDTPFQQALSAFLKRRMKLL